MSLAKLESALALALGIAAMLASLVLAWFGYALLSDGHVQTEGSSARAILGVLAYMAPISALLACLVGVGLIRRGLQA